MKSRFVKNLESIPFDVSQFTNPEFIPLQKAYNYICEREDQRATLLLLDFIKNELDKSLKKESFETPLKMLIIDELPRLNRKIKDLAVDVMISVEEESLNKKQYQDFITRISKLKNQVS